jgi:HAD superfamily hydrolase (TIGR01549 family)
MTRSYDQAFNFQIIFDSATHTGRSIVDINTAVLILRDRKCENHKKTSARKGWNTMLHTEKRPIKACVFDLGNTLVNDTQLTKAASAEMGNWLCANGWIKSPEVFATAYQRFNYSTNRPFISHTFGEPDFFEQTFKTLSVDAVSPRDALEKYREILIEKVHPDADVVEAFRVLKENCIRLALLSNERVKRVDAYMEKTDLSHFFDTIIVSEEIGVEKPDPRIFREVLNRLEVEGEETIMFGDNEVADGACSRLGIFFVLVTAFKNKDWIWEEGSPFKPDYVMEKISRKEMQKFLDAVRV